ncbi:MAG: DUF924 family protein [Elainellaceae cyanobacterium]
MSLVDAQPPIPSRAQAVLSFWFGEEPEYSSLYDQRRKLWFGKKPAFDQAIIDQFRSLYEQAAAGQLDGWQQTPPSALALVLVLDQFPRNMFRDTPQAFATDAQACHLAKQAITQGFDRSLAPVQRMFFYLPLEHSESLEDQAQSVQMFQALAQVSPDLLDTLDYAYRHQDVIRRFGRFPHRNRILGRVTTPEEADFLQQPGSSF